MKYLVFTSHRKGSELTNNCLFYSSRRFFGLWNSFEYIKENTYSDECSPIDIFIVEDDRKGYDVGDLVYTTNIPLEVVKEIDKNHSDQPLHEWLIQVRDNKNSYCNGEIYGKVIATTNPELCNEFNLLYINDIMQKLFVEWNGFVDANMTKQGLIFSPSKDSDADRFIQLTDKSDRHELEIHEYKKLEQSHITLGWNPSTKGYDRVLKNRNGSSGTIIDDLVLKRMLKEVYELGCNNRDEGEFSEWYMENILNKRYDTSK